MAATWDKIATSRITREPRASPPAGLASLRPGTTKARSGGRAFVGVAASRYDG